MTMIPSFRIYGLVLLLSVFYRIPNSHSQTIPLAADKGPKIEWLTFEEAYQRIKKKPKMVFVDVYTEWCGWCKKMDSQTFSNPEIADYMNKTFYCVKLDAERKDTVVLDSVVFVNPNPENKRSSHRLAVELLRGKMSYPSYVFLNKKGEMITVVPGFHPPKEFEPMLHFFGDGAWEKMKWEEFSEGFKGKVQ